MENQQLPRQGEVCAFEGELYSEFYCQYQMNMQKVKKISEWPGDQKLQIFSFKRTTLLQEIAHVRFNELTILCLSSNSISSIQVLPAMHIPHLQNLDLGSNKIASVRVMKKASWPSLHTLTIHQNPFKEAPRLAEGNFPEIKALDLYVQWPFQQYEFPEQCFLFKMKAHSLLRSNLCREEFNFNRFIEAILFQKKASVFS